MSDRLKSETYNTLTSMGYSYAMVDKAYKASDDKSTEGVINYIFSNPDLMEGDSEQSYGDYQVRPLSSQTKPSQPTPADLELKAQLLLMGYDEYLIDACIQSMSGYKTAENCLNWIENNMHKIKPPSKPVASKTHTSARDSGYGGHISKTQPTQSH